MLTNRYISQHVITNLNHNVSGINHNIDELLVGVVTQIRLKQAAGQHKEKRTKMDKVRIVLKMETTWFNQAHFLNRSTATFAISIAVRRLRHREGDVLVYQRIDCNFQII